MAEDKYRICCRIERVNPGGVRGEIMRTEMVIVCESIQEALEIRSVLETVMCGFRGWTSKKDGVDVHQECPQCFDEPQLKG